VKTNSTSTPKEMFCSVVKGVNFITPNVEEYGQVGRYIYELSSGRALDGGLIYGVTVVEVKEGGILEKADNLSKCFFSKDDVVQYLDYLAAKSTTHD